MKLHDLFWELVIDVCDKKNGHKFCDQIVWSLAISPDHVRSNVAELTWQNGDQIYWSQITISPVQTAVHMGQAQQFSTLIIIFPVNLVHPHGPSPAKRPLIFLAVAYQASIFFYSPFFYLSLSTVHFLFGPQPFYSPITFWPCPFSISSTHSSSFYFSRICSTQMTNISNGIGREHTKFLK